MKSHSHFTGEILREDIVCAKIIDDKVVDMNEYAPIYIQNTKDFLGWLEMRSADYNRSFMRAIARVLKLPMHGSIEAVKSVNATCITDTYWIRDNGINIAYADTVFKNNDFFMAALSGDASIFNSKLNSKTPELTNIGSFNKGWLLSEGKWVLYKSGTDAQYFSELFVSKLGQAIGLNMVNYYMHNGFIACDNFVSQGQCFEPAKSIIGDNIDYMFNIEHFKKYDLLKSYLDLIFLDAVVFNVDRHEFNYGVITEPDMPTIMAPNFDNNLALFGYNIPKKFTRSTNDILTKDFLNVMNSVQDYTVPAIHDDVMMDCISETLQEVKISVDPKDIYDYTMSAYDLIIKANRTSLV